MLSLLARRYLLRRQGVAQVEPLPFRSTNPCRSELAREKNLGAEFIQDTRVIVGVFREQARSYTGLRRSAAICLWLLSNRRHAQ